MKVAIPSKIKGKMEMAWLVINFQRPSEREEFAVKIDDIVKN